MRSIFDYLAIAWNYKFSLVPVLATYFIFDLPALIRRAIRRAYVPIYFMFFPLGHADELYAQYFNEDDAFRVCAPLTAEERVALRRHIQAIAIFSMVFSAIIAPWLCGALVALYLTLPNFGNSGSS